MEENEIFKLINKNNPHPGKPFEDWKVISNNGEKLYRIYSWMTGLSNDILVSGKCLLKKLKTYFGEEISVQIYYDIVCLGIQSIEERPKCIICGKPVKFDRLSEKHKGQGSYFKTCSDSCNKRRKADICISAVKSGNNINDFYREKIKSEEYRSNMSKIKKGTIFSESHKTKISESIKKFRKTEKGKELGRKLGELASIRNIENLKNPIESEYSDLNRKGRYKVGTYNSNVWNIKFRYDSSWELFLLKIFEKSSIVSDIKIFDRCKDSVHYFKDDGSLHRYLPDFYVKFKSGLEVVIEIKPANLVKNDRVVLLKRIAAKKYFSKKGIKYIILTENELFNNINGSFNIYDYII